MTRSDQARLLDIIASSEMALRIRDEGRDAFDSDWKNLPVAAQMIANIGASAVHLSPTTTAAFPDIPWDDIRDMRNLVAHEYHNIDPEIVWNTLETDIPDLMRALGVEPDIGIDPPGPSVGL